MGHDRTVGGQYKNDVESGDDDDDITVTITKTTTKLTI